MMSYAPSLKVKAQAELELRQRRRARQVVLRSLPIADFAARTKIEVPVGATETALYPFVLWSAQLPVADAMDHDRLLVILKARQLGISWLACLYALRLCTLWPGQPVLALSRSQDDADALVHRMSVMYREHSDRMGVLPRLIKDNTADLEWDNGSTVTSLAATKNAGRGFTGSLVILDEWAFMAWPKDTLAAVKPTIDAGGKLWIISSADGLGSTYHQHWQASMARANGYTPIFLPWTARPDRGPTWRDEKLAESGGDVTTVYREYPASDIEAFTHATGLVYDVWSDGPADGNVTDAAEYIPGGGEVVWAVDDGYEGRLDPATGEYTAGSAPRVFLLVQVRADGRLCVFEEHYAVKVLQEEHIRQVLALPYPEPDYAVVDSAAAELRGRLHEADIANFGKPDSIEESIKTMQRMLAPDQNGVRRVLVHPRCKHLRAEFASYRRDDRGKPIDAFNHGLDALRYLCWKMRYD